MNGQSEKMKSMRERPPKHRLHYNCVNDVAAYREDLRRQYKRINPAKEDGDERWEPMLRSLDPFVVYLKEAMRDSETGSQRALTPQHKQQEERLRCPTLSLVALPNEGDILTSTQVLGMGRGMDDKNKIAELASRGFKILRVKLVTLEEDCGFALVSLWRERTEEDTKSRRFRSKAPAG